MKRAIIAAFVASTVNAKEDDDAKCSITFVEYDDDACTTKTEKAAGEEYGVSYTAAETADTVNKDVVIDASEMKTITKGCVEPPLSATLFTKSLAVADYRTAIGTAKAGKMECTKEGLDVKIYSDKSCETDIAALSGVVKWGACHKANNEYGVATYIKMGPDPKDAETSGAIGLKAAAAAVLAFAALVLVSASLSELVA
jgi:hypothetical protein